MSNFKKGDRVRLLSRGGYTAAAFHIGAEGTVVEPCGSGAMVRVDGSEHRSGLFFFPREIESIEPRRFPNLSFKDKFGDVLEVMNNSKSTDDLYFRLPAELKGVVLNKEQALLLATEIKDYFR
jgi:hypothetical protein